MNLIIGVLFFFPLYGLANSESDSCIFDGDETAELLDNMTSMLSKFKGVKEVEALKVEFKESAKKLKKIIGNMTTQALEAFFDPQTGVKNMKGYRAKFPKIVETAIKEGKAIGFLFIDANKFKLINENLTAGGGKYEMGDLVIKLMAKIFQKHTTPGKDEVIRWGGDEFIIVLTVDIIDSFENAYQNVTSMIYRLFREFNQFVIEPKVVSLERLQSQKKKLKPREFIKKRREIIENNGTDYNIHPLKSWEKPLWPERPRMPGWPITLSIGAVVVDPTHPKMAEFLRRTYLDSGSNWDPINDPFQTDPIFMRANDQLDAAKKHAHAKADSQKREWELKNRSLIRKIFEKVGFTKPAQEDALANDDHHTVNALARRPFRVVPKSKSDPNE